MQVEQPILRYVSPAEMVPAFDKIEISLVVPLFNEEEGLSQLKQTLINARDLLEQKYRVHLILVDDGSTDSTWKQMNLQMAGLRDVTLLRHDRNLGIGAAIRTGIVNANTEIACSIDADCSYDPCELSRLISLLAPGVALVTASPYHPAGAVVGVPRWRLGFSRLASFFYRQILRQKLSTYTSCFRVYRRATFLNTLLRRSDFVAIAELIGRLDLQGSVVLECPTVLSVRLYGRSKMKFVRSSLRHLYLMAELLVLRLRQNVSSTSLRLMRDFGFGSDRA